MELWIRSQDKEKLCKVHDLCIRENQNENNETNYVIQDIYTMGTYKTEERALEVLDEIQEMDFKNNSNVKLTSYGYVYEMPKE